MFIIENIVCESSSTIKLVSADGDILTLHLEGDCCSSSFFDDNSVMDVQSLLGERLMDVTTEAWSCPTPDLNGDCPCAPYDGGDTQHSALIIKTDRQSISVLWRNESNGYYSGYLEMNMNGTEIDRWNDNSLKSFLE